MKKWSFLILILLLTLGRSVFSQNKESLTVMSWNIRLDTPDDGVNRWSNRKAGLCKEVTEQSPDILGVQEAMHSQMKDMSKCLKGYKSIGVGRDDGKKAGEYSAVFYKKRNVRLIRSGTFWLSEMPDVPGSRGWDAACNRVVTWGEFQDRSSGKHFMVFNTHFDHIGEVARIESAKLINRKIKELANGLPVILTGDFNVPSKHRAYSILTFPENEYVLIDTRERANIKSGPDFSWVSFSPDYKDTSLIDFIFTTYDIDVLEHKIYDFRQTGRYLSDHLPVTAVVTFK